MRALVFRSDDQWAIYSLEKGVGLMVKFLTEAENLLEAAIQAYGGNEPRECREDQMMFDLYEASDEFDIGGKFTCRLSSVNFDPKWLQSA